MRIRDLTEWGRIVKGVNTTPDVGVGEIPRQAAKFGNTVDKDGKPPTLSSKVKGKRTNVLFNLGLSEGKQFTEAMGEIASATEIYVDMDGVIADFFGEWAKLMDVDHFTDINKQHDINDALQKIRDTDDFWLRLPVLPEAKNLLNLIKEVKGEYSICTSPLADDPNSEKHKRTWVEKNLAFFPPKEVHVTHNKPQFATAKDGTPNILIDDYGVNINAWEAAGGIGFKYKDHKFERTAKDIKQHMQEPVEENFPRDVDAEIKSDQAQYKETFNVYRQGVDTYLEDDLVLTPEIIKTWSDSWKRFPTLIPNLMDYYKKKKAYKGENFADGKVKGKSKPGRVKKSGASCNGSVTDLRAKAKKASGEKAKMLHWCANMKSGRS